MDGDGWTDARVALLGKLWGDGLSASQIVTSIAASDRVFFTRSAVIGKINREREKELLLRGVTQTFDRRRDPNAVPKPRRQRAPRDRPVKLKFAPREKVARLAAGRRAPRPPAGDMPAPESRNITLLDLTDRVCKWPSKSAGRTHLFCGCQHFEELPYCEYHGRLAYRAA
jgi:GcrA cell cycle regulator